MSVPITAKQVQFLQRLNEELGIDASFTFDEVDRKHDRQSLSRLIDRRLAEAKSKRESEGETHERARDEGWPDVAQGHYAVERLDDTNDLDFYRVDRPEEGKWAGRTFVKQIIGGRPAERVEYREVASVLQRIVDADPAAAAVRYGREIGRCARCNRELTDETSRASGYGPDCREMLGIDAAAPVDPSDTLLDEVAENMAARQAFDPQNVDDAVYALAHPGEFDAATRSVCETTVARSPLYGNRPEPTLDEQIERQRQSGNWFVDGKLAIVERAASLDEALAEISRSCQGMTMDYASDYAKESTAARLAREVAERRFAETDAVTT